MDVFDLHIHTRYSDGVMEVREAIMYARKIGLKGISITDHNTLKGSLKALQLSKELKLTEFIVIPGIEISCRYGHILVYGLTSIRRYNSVSELIDIVKEEGGVVALAHPYGKLFFLPHKAVKDENLLSRFDAIEVINGKTPPISNRKAQELSKRLNKPGIGGSDAHMLQELGTVGTIINNYYASSSTNVLKAIKLGLCKAVGGRSFTQILASTINRRLLYGIKKSLSRRIKGLEI